MSKEKNLNKMMEKLNKLASAVKKAPDAGMKQIWTDKWYALVKQYASTIQSMEPSNYHDRLND